MSDHPKKLAPFTPAAGHHPHLFSPAIAEVLAAVPQAILARDVVDLLDLAGIHSALVLSAAYMYGSPNRAVVDELTPEHASLW